ncbi:hypothetical protein TNCV_1035601 [Trichonephila clavipes]|nr:hypothetical protein TNCV_1035601 [Trichonephila clavipes]
MIEKCVASIESLRSTNANTTDNTEDLISSGVYYSKIQQLDIWWSGSSFLSFNSWSDIKGDPVVPDVEHFFEIKGTEKNSELTKDPMINLYICNNPI